MKMQYWEPSPYAKVFEPDIEECVIKLKDVVKNYDDYLKKFSPKMKEVLPNYTWTNVANQILNLCR